MLKILKKGIISKYGMHENADNIRGVMGGEGTLFRHFGLIPQPCLSRVLQFFFGTPQKFGLFYSLIPQKF